MEYSRHTKTFRWIICVQPRYAGNGRQRGSNNCIFVILPFKRYTAPIAGMAEWYTQTTQNRSGATP